MRNCSGLLTLGLTVMLLAACQGNDLSRSGQPLSAAEIQRGIGRHGITSWGHTPQGESFVSFLAPDGLAKTRSTASGATDQGAWRVTPDGQLCIRWQQLYNGAETCAREYVRRHDLYDVLPDGKVLSIVTQQAEGNREGL